MTIKRMTRQYISILKINMSSLEIRLRKIDEARTYVLNEIKQWFNKWKVLKGK